MLLAAMSLGGLLTGAYAREAPAWIEQAVGQDWFDLVIAAPLIAICGVGARTSARWRVLLAGAYAYTVYERKIWRHGDSEGHVGFNNGRVQFKSSYGK